MKKIASKWIFLKNTYTHTHTYSALKDQKYFNALKTILGILYIKEKTLIKSSYVLVLIFLLIIAQDNYFFYIYNMYTIAQKTTKHCIIFL